MPLRYIRKTLSAESALTVAVATTAIGKELADLLQFPPARAAAGILFLIFQTIQDIQTNRSECYRLAKRCLSLLTDVRDTMAGRWGDAPESLIRNITKFESILQTIHEALTQEAQNKWRSRLMRKSTIETALTDYNLMLDDAARSFQIATLINIHYALESSTDDWNDRKKQSRDSSVTDYTIVAPLLEKEPICESPGSLTFSDVDVISIDGRRLSSDGFSRISSSSSASVSSAGTSLPPSLDEIESELASLQDHGFRRYHQSEITFNGPSRIKSGWWAGSKEVQVEGRSLLMVPYNGSYASAAKRWIRDVKTLQNVYHPNLPQMVGYSGTDIPTPFILLANVQTRLPQALVLDALKNASLLDCARLLIRFYKDIFDAALYMQRQLLLTDSKTQDYVENASFRIDGLETMIMGLPPPEVHDIQCYRNFGLAHSVREIFIQLIPNRGLARRPVESDSSVNPKMQRKVNHLGLLVRSILPSEDEVATAASRLQQLLGDDEDEEAEPISLPLIRMSAIRARSHGQSWNNNFVPAHMFQVGDIGYVASGEDFKSFVKLRNILDTNMVDMEINPSATGWKTHMEMGRFDRQQLQPFELPGGVSGWPIVLEAGTRQNIQVVHEHTFRYVSDAWKALLDCADELARAHGLKPEDLMLVTRTGIDQRFMVHDMRHVPMHGHHQRPGHGFPPQFGAHHMQHHMQHSNFPHHASSVFGPPPPAVFYLFSSAEKGHESYISETPAYLPPALQAQRPSMRAKCLWGQEGTFGFMNYVQLHEEDFL